MGSGIVSFYATLPPRREERYENLLSRGKKNHSFKGLFHRISLATKSCLFIDLFYPLVNYFSCHFLNHAIHFILRTKNDFQVLPKLKSSVNYLLSSQYSRKNLNRHFLYINPCFQHFLYESPIKFHQNFL